MMDVVVCQAPGDLRVAVRPNPVRAPGEVLVRIRRVGVCGTDYHIFRGKQPYLEYPRVMGHELAGEVEEGDEAGEFVAGQQVCLIPYLSCGHCGACRAGKTNCCVRIQVLGVHRDGGLAEYVSVDRRFVVDASGLTLEAAAMVEFLAIGYHAVRRGEVTPGQRVLVQGVGPIGMAVALFAAQAGAHVTVLDGNPQRTRFCIDLLGAEQSVGLGETLQDDLARCSGGDGFDVMFEATGSPSAIEAGFKQVAHGGSYVLVSVVASDITFSDPEFHKREMSLRGSRNATRADFEAVIEVIRSGAVPVTAMHTHSGDLHDLPTDLPGWMVPEAGVIKAIVTV